MTAATTQQVTATHERMVADIERAIIRVGWGTMGKPVVAVLKHDDDRVTLRARAMLPDGRRAWIEASSQAQGPYVVAVRVGDFGDEAREKLCIDQLRELLKAKAAPVRIGPFQLP